MIVKQDLINKIKDYFGLNVYETKVWLALLGKGIASAGEIATISGVPRSRTYDVLEGLEKRGFVLIKLEKPVKYIGVKPHVILEKLKNDVQNDAKEKMVSLSNIKGTEEYKEILNIYSEGINPIKREDISASLKGRSNITNHLKEILQNAKKEVIICMDAKEFNAKLKLFQSTIEILNENKIKVKVALSGDEELIKQLSKKFKIKFKKVNIDAKFFVIDRTEMLFYVTKDSEDELAIWLNSDFFAQAFSILFDKALGSK